jgi:hypothetical protein
MTWRYYSGSYLQTQSTNFWTGGFRSKYTKTWTWCKRHNSTTFGAIYDDVNGNYNFTENQELSNATIYMDCMFGFMFDKSSLYCWSDYQTAKMICESTDQVTYADLVNVTLIVSI